MLLSIKGLVTAKHLVDDYGTVINDTDRQWARAQVADLNLPNYVGYYCSVFQTTNDPSKPYRLLTPPSFTDDQIALSLLSQGKDIRSLTERWTSSNGIRQGQRVRVIEKLTGYSAQHADVALGDIGVVQYVDGCCLCVKTDKAEFTANAERFEPID